VPGAYEIYNLGGTGTISLAELVQTIEQVVGKKAIIVRQPDQPGDVPITFANIDRARAALGYEPTTRSRRVSSGTGQPTSMKVSRPGAST